MGSITFQKIENIEALSLANEVLCYAINIGEQMLISGAEVGRVEDSIRRICLFHHQRLYQTHCYRTHI